MDLKTAAALVERFQVGRAALRAHPTMLDESIGKLSDAAQEPAKKFRALLMSDEEDLTKMNAMCAAMKEGLSEDVRKEFEEHKHDVARLIGLTTGSAR